MKFVKPVRLIEGDWVGVVAPSDAVERRTLEQAIKIPKSWGLKIALGRHIYSKVGDFSAGTAEERISDIRDMIFDPKIKAIWCATGGYAATEVLPVFDREVITHLKENPKWLIGYSDVCLLQNALTSFGLVSLMGPSLWGLPEWSRESQKNLKDILFGEQTWGLEKGLNWKPALIGNAEGRIVANDLETLVFSFGTKFDPIMYGGNDPIILVIEELDIDKSTLQRQVDIIFNHKRANRIKGLVVGRLVNILEFSYPEWGKKVTAKGLILERTRKFGIPLAFCEDFGHPQWDYPPFAELKRYFANRNFYSLPNGVKARLEVSDKYASLQFLETICETGRQDDQTKS